MGRFTAACPIMILLIALFVSGAEPVRAQLPGGDEATQCTDCSLLPDLVPRGSPWWLLWARPSELDRVVV